MRENPWGPERQRHKGAAGECEETLDMIEEDIRSCMRRPDATRLSLACILLESARLNQKLYPFPRIIERTRKAHEAWERLLEERREELQLTLEIELYQRQGRIGRWAAKRKAIKGRKEESRILVDPAVKMSALDTDMTNPIIIANLVGMLYEQKGGVLELPLIYSHFLGGVIIKRPLDEEQAEILEVLRAEGGVFKDLFTAVAASQDLAQ